VAQHPQREGSADNRGNGNRAEVAAVERRRFIPVHEENLVTRDKATALPNGERTATRILRERSAHRFAVDRDEQCSAANGLPLKSEDSFDQRQPERQVTAFSKDGREPLGRCGDHKIGNREFAGRLDTIAGAAWGSSSR